MLLVLDRDDIGETAVAPSETSHVGDVDLLARVFNFACIFVLNIFA